KMEPSACTSWPATSSGFTTAVSSPSTHAGPLSRKKSAPTITAGALFLFLWSTHVAFIVAAANPKQCTAGRPCCCALPYESPCANQPKRPPSWPGSRPCTANCAATSNNAACAPAKPHTDIPLPGSCAPKWHTHAPTHPPPKSRTPPACHQCLLSSSA